MEMRKKNIDNLERSFKLKESIKKKRRKSDLRQSPIKKPINQSVMDEIKR